MKTTTMANMNESMEQLTASLQELTAKTYGHTSICEAVAGKVPANELQVSKEVETFVEDTRAYANKTRDVSVGKY
jgi:hypothetical protein